MIAPIEIRVDARIALASAEHLLLRAIREGTAAERQLREAEYLTAYERVHGPPKATAPRARRKNDPMSRMR